MDNRKWLKRKYPKIFNEVNEFLNDKELETFRKHNYKLGRLIENVSFFDLYPAGTLIAFKRSNPITSYNYPMHHAIVKCDAKLTESGYLSIDVFDSQFKSEEVTNETK